LSLDETLFLERLLLPSNAFRPCSGQFTIAFAGWDRLYAFMIPTTIDTSLGMMMRSSLWGQWTGSKVGTGGAGSTGGWTNETGLFSH
jgi:hypothetical protein